MFRCALACPSRACARGQVAVQLLLLSCVVSALSIRDPAPCRGSDIAALHPRTGAGHPNSQDSGLSRNLSPRIVNLDSSAKRISFVSHILQLTQRIIGHPSRMQASWLLHTSPERGCPSRIRRTLIGASRSAQSRFAIERAQRVGHPRSNPAGWATGLLTKCRSGSYEIFGLGASANKCHFFCAFASLRLR